MPLKFKFKSREEIPAEHQALYVERDGAFVLDAEGAVEKSKVDEFRTNWMSYPGKNPFKRGADWNLTEQDIARIHNDAQACLLKPVASKGRTCHPPVGQVTWVSPNVYRPPVTLLPPCTPWVPPSIVLILILRITGPIRSKSEP